MTSINNRIYLLDDASQSKIKYSVQIISLTDVVLELIKNALDAYAENIKITLNYAHGFCSILDDGHGISAQEFEPDGGLGKPFHTSKIGRAHETYGCNGRYLAALSAMSLLSVASRVNGDDTHVLWLDQSGRLRHAREPPDTIEFETGTRVKVYGLFSKLPVRSKSLTDRFASPSEVQKEFEKLTNGILGLILAASRRFSIVVEHSSPKHRYRYRVSQEQTLPLSLSHNKSLSCVNSAIRQTGHADTSQLCQWQETAIQSGGVTLHGLLSTLPMPHKRVQYLSLNHLPLTRQAQPDLFQSINLMFEQSTFGSALNANATETETDVSQHKRRLRSHVKEIDKWPMFIIWINTASDSIHELVRDTVVSPRAQRLLGRITSLMQSLIEEFLVTYDYSKPRKQRAPRAPEATRDANTSQAAFVDKRRDQSKESFRHWSRVKSSRESVMDNILAGLPFHHKADTNQEEVLSIAEDSKHPSRTSNTSKVIGDVEASVLSPSADEKANVQDCVLWTDTQTGRVLRLDPRTGMELPSCSALVNAGIKSSANQDSTTLDPTNSFKMGRSSHEEEPELSLAEVARNVRRYYQNLPHEQDQVVRTIGFFTHIEEDFEQYRSTATNLKAESFWAGIDRCGSHHCVQRETPSISIKALRSARVLRQVNREFILALMQEQSPGHSTHQVRSEQLVLIDQHAADERCKVEALLKSVYEDEGVQLITQITSDVSKRESDLLQSASAYFAQWNILYDLSERQMNNSERPIRQVTITSLPSAIAERCRLHPEFIINILREEIYSDRITIQYTETTQPTNPKSVYNIPIPPRLLEMINSRACRSAIMFNDDLTIQQCEAIVKQLSACTLPFQCAHGRPSMVVLADTADLPVNRPLAAQVSEISTYFNVNRNTSKSKTRSINPHTIKSRGTHNQTSHTADRPSTQQPRHKLDTTLNTIENNTMDFAQAYHSWTNLQQ